MKTAADFLSIGHWFESIRIFNIFHILYIFYGFATVITLLLVPVFYSIFVLDLKIVKWEAKGAFNSP